MNDRFADLRGGGGDSTPLLSNSADPADVQLDVMGSGGGGGGGQSAFMAAFFSDVGIIKKNMALIKRNIKLISEKHQDALAAVTTSEGARNTEQLDQLMSNTNATAQQVRNQLKLMEKSNKEFEAHNDSTPSEIRIRNNLHGTLARNFVEIMSEYQEIQNDYKSKYHERVKRQVMIVKPNASSDDVDRALSGDTDSIFRQEIVQQGPLYNQARNALADIQDKHKDILKIESSIQELHQIFLDMAVLVESQGELLDQIEYTVGQAVAHTDKGVKELQQARKYQKASRKKMCCLIILFLGIGIAIALPIILTSAKKEG